MSEAERELRVNLAACYRLVAKYGMTDPSTTTSPRACPGHILISAYGMLYEEVTASSLIKVDLAGNIVAKPDHGYSVNAAGYIIHSAVHEAREDAQCVIHTHTRAGIAVSAMEALSGTEITLDNETATNPSLKADAQKSGTGYGLLEWPALLRPLDRVDPSYRN